MIEASPGSQVIADCWRSFLFAITVLSLCAIGCDGPGLPQSGAAQTRGTEEQPKAEMLVGGGSTMATRYEVKIFDPPDDLSKDWRLLVDLELRRVNDQMSTYLATSEISQFNANESLDWVSVSKETAQVVAAALKISEDTGGAFDVTVGPLVNLWSFGTTERTNKIPTDQQIAEARASVGYQSLHVRTDPPALRKDIPQLRVDLSSIAKGHGVDRIIQLLSNHGCKSVFVNIGGEISAIGDKGTEGPWKAGVERPDEITTVLLFPVPLNNEAIATSGDYRNYFSVDGKRYSHTIDPRTAAPVTHEVATVSVVAENCMIADGWATALNVLGPKEGMEIAKKCGIDAFILQRSEKRFVPYSHGRFVQWSKLEAPSKR